jgi:3-oxoadipate enol-lactonase
VEMMAADCLAVLDAAGESTAHVVGISMGGLVAQEIALTAPSRVASLALLATHPGTAQGTWPPEVYEFLMARASMEAEERGELSIPFNYAPGTSRDLIEEDWQVRAAGTAGPVGYAAQGGTALWSGFDRLPGLTPRTLVLHGEQDRLVVPENGRTIAARVPGAQLVLVPNANHILTTDQAEVVNRLLLDWFAA